MLNSFNEQVISFGHFPVICQVWLHHVTYLNHFQTKWILCTHSRTRLCTTSDITLTNKIKTLTGLLVQWIVTSHVRFISILTWLRGFRVKIVNFLNGISFVFQFPKQTWIQRKQHQIQKFVLKASEPCENINISIMAYCNICDQQCRNLQAFCCLHTFLLLHPDCTKIAKSPIS